MQPKKGRPRVRSQGVEENRKEREVCPIPITDNMLDDAEKRFAELDRSWFSKSPGRLRARKAEALAVIIRSRGLHLTVHEVAVAQEEFKRMITQRRAKRTRKATKQRLAEEAAIESERRLRGELEIQGVSTPGQNCVTSVETFYSSDQALREAQLLAYERGDHLLPDP